MPRSSTFLLLAGLAGCAAGDDDPTVPLVFHDGYAHRLVIKLEGEAPAMRGGKLDLAATDAALDRLVQQHRLSVAPLVPSSGKRDAIDSATGGFLAVELGDPRDRAALDLARSFGDLASVEYVYLEPLAVPPPTDLAPPTDDLSAEQGYRAAIDIDFAVATGATGAGVRLSDCEYGWNLAHEDLMETGGEIEPGQTVAPDVAAFGWDDHGTAVIGITSAPSNGYGVSGMVPDASLAVFPEWTVEGSFRRAAAISAAVAASQPGDVVLLEMQTSGPGGGYGPAELDPAVWAVVKQATDAGIIVVAAAGNGSQDLDSADYAEYRSRGDSGAILVGAGSAARSPLFFTTYGSAVHVQGWGEQVVTAGYGDVVFGDGVNQDYTRSFGGTSSASPIVTSAVVAVQSYAKAVLGRPLTPLEMRQLLIDTGTPQDATTVAQHIGPLPNVRRAIEALQP